MKFATSSTLSTQPFVNVRNLNRRFDELEKAQNFISTKYDSVMEAIQALKKQNQSVENQIHTIEENASALNSNGLISK